MPPTSIGRGLCRSVNRIGSAFAYLSSTCKSDGDLYPPRWQFRKLRAGMCVLSRSLPRAYLERHPWTAELEQRRGMHHVFESIRIRRTDANASLLLPYPTKASKVFLIVPFSSHVSRSTPLVLPSLRCIHLSPPLPCPPSHWLPSFVLDSRSLLGSRERIESRKYSGEIMGRDMR